MDMSFKISDPDKVLDKLVALPKKFKNKVARKALRQAMNIVRDAARANAAALDNPETELNIAKFIVTAENSRLGRRNNGVAMRVGVMGGARPLSGDPPPSPWYWRFVEFGTAKQPAQPFMRNAFEQNIPQVVDKLMSELKKGLDEIAKENP